MTFAVANNRNTSIKDRADSALTTVQHNNYAMNILRLRLSSGINFIISCKGKPQHYQGSAWVLELVKVPLTIFDEDKSNKVSSISEVKDDVEQRVEQLRLLFQSCAMQSPRYRRCFCQSRGRRSNQSSLQGCLPCLQQAKQYSRVYDK